MILKFFTNSYKHIQCGCASIQILIFKIPTFQVLIIIEKKNHNLISLTFRYIKTKVIVTFEGRCQICTSGQNFTKTLLHVWSLLHEQTILHGLNLFLFFFTIIVNPNPYPRSVFFSLCFFINLSFSFFYIHIFSVVFYSPAKMTLRANCLHTILSPRANLSSCKIDPSCNFEPLPLLKIIIPSNTLKNISCRSLNC